MRSTLNKIAVAVLIVVIVAALSIGLVLQQSQKPPGTAQIVIRGIQLTVELAETPADQERGLSGRNSMASDRGMLFVFPRESQWTFWMKDMRFSLDIIWFDTNRRVVHIEQNLIPCSPEQCAYYTSSANALYVLEVNAGFVQVHGITLGDTFNFIG